MNPFTILGYFASIFIGGLFITEESDHVKEYFISGENFTAFFCRYTTIPLVGYLFSVIFTSLTNTEKLSMLVLTSCPSSIFSSYYCALLQCNVSLTYTLNCSCAVASLFLIPFLVTSFDPQTYDYDELFQSLPFGEMIASVLLVVFPPMICIYYIRPQFQDRVHHVARYSAARDSTAIVEEHVMEDVLDERNSNSSHGNGQNGHDSHESIEIRPHSVNNFSVKQSYSVLVVRYVSAWSIFLLLLAIFITLIAYENCIIFKASWSVWVSSLLLQPVGTAIGYYLGYSFLRCNGSSDDWQVSTVITLSNGMQDFITAYAVCQAFYPKRDSRVEIIYPLVYGFWNLVITTSLVSYPYVLHYLGRNTNADTDQEVLFESSESTSRVGLNILPR